jgi:hypothetical protein
LSGSLVRSVQWPEQSVPPSQPPLLELLVVVEVLPVEVVEPPPVVELELVPELLAVALLVLDPPPVPPARGKSSKCTAQAVAQAAQTANPIVTRLNTITTMPPRAR